MQKGPLPIYQIQDFKASTLQENYFYVSSFAAHLQEHLFIQKPHKHSFYILILVTKGSGTHTIDFKTYDVKPDTAFFILPGQVHSWNLSDDADGYIVFFTAEFYKKEFPEKKLYEFPFFNATQTKPLLSLNQQDSLALQQMLQALQHEYQVRNRMKNEMLCCQLHILLIMLARIYFTESGTETEKQNTELTQLQQLESLIELHYREHLPVTYYAGRLNVTAKHLNDICKRSLDKTTTELLRLRLLLEAQRLLLHSDLTVSQIADTLGYLDNAYFFRFFKKNTGTTPEQFRTENK